MIINSYVTTLFFFSLHATPSPFHSLSTPLPSSSQRYIIFVSISFRCLPFPPPSSHQTFSPIFSPHPYQSKRLLSFPLSSSSLLFSSHLQSSPLQASPPPPYSYTSSPLFSHHQFNPPCLYTFIPPLPHDTITNPIQFPQLTSRATTPQGSKATMLCQAYHRYALNYINALNYLETLRRQLEFCEFEKVSGY